jgi:uncharacterized protein YihD (DUF1040 family)
MPREFVSITAAEMDTLLTEFGFSYDPNFDTQTTEKVYTHRYDDGRVLAVYTTIRKYSPESRGYGKDAIRLLVFQPGVHQSGIIPSYKLVGGAKKTLRIRGWQVTLRQKIVDTVIRYKLYNKGTDSETPVIIGVDLAAEEDHTAAVLVERQPDGHIAIINVSFKDQEQKVAETLSFPDSAYRSCVVCGHEATTKTEEGDPVCPWHTFVDESFRTWMAV